jgi:hypothetical protein
MLDYRGVIGLQYNPIAIAQWGLANYNQFREAADESRWQKTRAAADWMCANLEQNSYGLWVWNHHFDWEYRDTLKAPWYSGLAQGQGVSLLLRVHAHTGDPKYLQAAEQEIDVLLGPQRDDGRRRMHVVRRADRNRVKLAGVLIQQLAPILVPRRFGMLFAGRFQGVGVHVAQRDNFHPWVTGHAFHGVAAHAAHAKASDLELGVGRGTPQNRGKTQNTDGRGSGSAEKLSAFHGNTVIQEKRGRIRSTVTR